MSFKVHSVGGAKLIPQGSGADGKLQEGGYSFRFWDSLEKRSASSNIPPRISIPQFFTGGARELYLPIEESAGYHYLTIVNRNLKGEKPIICTLDFNQTSSRGEEINYPGQCKIYGSSGKEYIIGRGDR